MVKHCKVALFAFLLNSVTIGNVFSQKLEFKPKLEFFSFPFTQFQTEEVTDIKVDNDGYVWIISFSSIYKYNGVEFSKIETQEIKHEAFLRFHESNTGVKYVTDIKGAVFFIYNEAIIASNENTQLQQLNAYNSMLDIRLDGKCFTASFSHDGVKRIVENKI